MIILLARYCHELKYHASRWKPATCYLIRLQGKNKLHATYLTDQPCVQQPFPWDLKIPVSLDHALSSPFCIVYTSLQPVNLMFDHVINSWYWVKTGSYCNLVCTCSPVLQCLHSSQGSDQRLFFIVLEWWNFRLEVY
jgi:hypothetical protein